MTIDWSHFTPWASLAGGMLIGAAAVLPFGVSPKAALAFGVMISLSSTAIVLRMLMERAELDMPHGRNSLAVLLTQDIAVVPLAIVMTLLAGGGGAVGVVTQVMKLLGTALAPPGAVEALRERSRRYRVQTT